MGHVQDEHQRDPLPESAHQPAGGLPPDLPPLRRLGQPQRLSARPRVRPPLRLLRVGVQARRRRNALLEGRIQVRKSKSPEFDSKPSKFFAPKWQNWVFLNHSKSKNSLIDPSPRPNKLIVDRTFFL